MVFFSPGLAWATANAAPAGGDGSSRAGVATLPAALRPALYQALAHDAGPADVVGNKGCATLPKQQLKGCFTAAGASFTGTGDKPHALWLSAWGRGTVMHAVSQVAPAIKGNRVSYTHGTLTEWWRVLPVGFEQSFTVTQGPQGDGELTLALAASDRASLKGGTLAWGKLRYGNLVVTDANGKTVPATLKSDGNRVVIAVDDAHAIYPLTVDPLVWIEQKVISGDGAADDLFGYSVAVDGTTALVGAPQVFYSEGAAYVFTRTGGTWSEAQELYNPVSISFGTSVALDGDTAVIGSPGDTVGFADDAGAVYVFTRTGGTWSQTQRLTASDYVRLDNFGGAVAFDGSTLLAGATGHNNDMGAAYVFSESGGTWSQMQELAASDGVPGDEFGSGIALDGTTALIGASQFHFNQQGGPGAAYVFSESGGTWSQAQKLVASDGAENDDFGAFVALDGATALVGADAHNDYQGAAYVFTESGGTWGQTQELAASDGVPGDDFGGSVALDGTTALVGAIGHNNGKGVAYVFTDSDGIWSQAQELTASDGAAGDFFGYSVDLAGTTALVGASFATVNGNLYQGAAYFYGQSDLGVAVSAPDTVGQGQQYVSQTIATNNASAASPAVSATISVPAAASFVSATASQGSCSEDSGVVTCDFGPINANAGTATANVTLKATGNVGDTIHNTASVAKATPALTASAPTQITQGNCPDGYSEYDGTLNAGGIYASEPYQAPAGQENGILGGPDGFQLYAQYSNGTSHHIYRVPGNEIHRQAPAGTYRWGVKAGSTGGAYVLCILHP
jgi:hypothetical protein